MATQYLNTFRINPTDMNPDNVLYIGCGVLFCLVIAARRFPAESMLKRAMVGCLVCLLAMAVVDESGDAGARLREAAGLPMAVGMGAVVVFAVLRLRISR
jgi:hypothetical protein